MSLRVGRGRFARIRTTVRLDVKNGSTWKTVFTESDWSLQTYDISAFADGNSSLQIRFRQYGGPNIAPRHSGWNVDRFIIHTGNTRRGSGEGRSAKRGMTPGKIRSELAAFMLPLQMGGTCR